LVGEVFSLGDRHSISETRCIAGLFVFSVRTPASMVGAITALADQVLEAHTAGCAE
jgi:hypothetical protein